jgi:hypothetical protein
VSVSPGRAARHPSGYGNGVLAAFIVAELFNHRHVARQP